MTDNFVAHSRKKDGQTQKLCRHLLETSVIAGQFAGKIGLKKIGRLLGLLHDFGKASQDFQNYIRSATGLTDPDADEYVDTEELKGKIDHSTAGAQVIFENLSGKDKEGIIAAQFLSLCIASHHSGLIDCLTPDGKDNFTRRINKADELTHRTEASDNLRSELIKDLLRSGLEQQLVDVLRGLKESNDSKQTSAFKMGLLVRFLFSSLIDADRLSTADFEFPENKKLRNQNTYIPWEVLIERFNAKQFDNQNRIDEIRSRVSQQCFDFATKPKGLYQLTVPTGGGKTFASLRFSLSHAREHGMDRIFFVIPFTSIIDQNADEVRKILEEKHEDGSYSDKVILEHHSNLTPEEETKRQNLLAENWDAPIVFTTNVQFLEALFGAGTRSARRMHQLANAVIIFDEVQTIPIKCVQMFNVALRFLVKGCGATVVLCTATQPLLDKIEIKERALKIAPDQQMMKDVRALFSDLIRVNVNDSRKVGGWSEEEVVEIARSELSASGSVLIVVNTKPSAKSIYQRLTQSDLKDVFHLSTDMCPEHRMNVLNQIKLRLVNHEPTICVSTQLIEAGVDIDFGSVIRFIAGLDSVAQAAGRCNRHGLRSIGNVFIVNPYFENLDRLPEIRIGAEKAERVLSEFKDTPERFDGDILSPSAIAQYYKYYFYDRKDKMNYPVSANTQVGRDDNLFDLLSTNQGSAMEYERVHHSACSLPLKQSFQTASKAFRPIDSATRGIIVPYGVEGAKLKDDLCAAYEVERQFKLLKKAQRYTVNVFENVFRDLADKQIVHEVQEGTGIYYADSQYYSDEFGLSKEIVNEPEILIQ